MCARAPKNWACRWKSTSPSASPPCGSTPTPWGCAALSDGARLAPKFFRTRGWSQRWAYNTSAAPNNMLAITRVTTAAVNHLEVSARAEIGRFAFRALDNRRAGRCGGRGRRCDGRESRRLQGLRRLRRNQPVNVLYFGNKTVALARNGIHERGLIRGIAENLPELVHSGVHVGIVVDVGVRRPELHAQLFASYDFARLLKERKEGLIDLALQLNPRPVLEKFFSL